MLLGLLFITSSFAFGEEVEIARFEYAKDCVPKFSYDNWFNSYRGEDRDLELITKYYDAVKKGNSQMIINALDSVVASRLHRNERLVSATLILNESEALHKIYWRVLSCENKISRN